MNTITVTVIVTGHPVAIAPEQNATTRDLATQAMAKVRVHSPDMERWEMTTEAGQVLPWDAPADAFQSGTTLFLSMTAGICASSGEPVAVEGAGAEAQTRFGNLWVGDRFTAYGDLWTKLGHDTARQHSKASIALGCTGSGYVGDTVCSFDRGDECVFQSPATQSVQTAAPTEPKPDMARVYALIASMFKQPEEILRSIQAQDLCRELGIGVHAATAQERKSHIAAARAMMERDEANGFLPPGNWRELLGESGSGTAATSVPTDAKNKEWLAEAARLADNYALSWHQFQKNISGMYRDARDAARTALISHLAASGATTSAAPTDERRVPQEAPTDLLQQAIMNLQCNVPQGYPYGSELCAGVYREGHRDAIRAAIAALGRAGVGKVEA